MFWIEPQTPDILASPPAHDDFWYSRAPGIFTQSGNRITESTAVRVTAVWSCLRILTESVGQLPVHLYRRVGTDKERVTDHPAARVLENPGNDLTRMELVEHSTFHVESCGRSFWEIAPGRGRAAVLGELVPHLPQNVKTYYNGIELRDSTIVGPNGRITYRVRTGDGERTIDASRMVHFRGGMIRHPLQSLSPVGELREAIGATQAASDYGSRFFRNDTTPRGYLRTEGKLKDDEAADEIRRKWIARQGGIGQHSLAVLSQGLEYKELGMSNEDAQFLETRQYNARDIARIWRVPAHMLNEMTGAIKANVEQMGLEFVIYSLMSRLTRFETRLNRGLLGPEEREELFFEVLVDGLMRADIRSRYFSYRQATGGAAWFTPNEVRGLENMPPIEGGDTLMQPMNMSLGPGAAPDSEQQDPDERELEEQEREEAADALAASELAEVAYAHQQQRPGRFLNWSRVFYDRVGARLSVALGIPIDQARTYAEQSFAELAGAGPDNIDQVLDHWRANKARDLKRLIA